MLIFTIEKQSFCFPVFSLYYIDNQNDDERENEREKIHFYDTSLLLYCYIRVYMGVIRVKYVNRKPYGIVLVYNNLIKGVV